MGFSEFTVGWFGFTVGWGGFTVGWFGFTVGWFGFTVGWFGFAVCLCGRETHARCAICWDFLRFRNKFVGPSLFA